MTNQQAAKLSEPRVGTLNDPAAFIAPEFSSIFIAPLLVVLAVRCDQFNASLLQALAQRIGIVSAVGNHPLRILPGWALGLGDADFRQCGFRKRNFCRRGTFQPNSQRNTFTVCQYHPLRALAALGFADGEAPFFAGAKLPSRKVSSQRSRPFSSSAPSKHATLPATHLPPASVATAASRSRGREIRPAKIARRRRFAESTEYPRNILGSLPVAAHVGRAVASVWETRARSVPIARPSTASAVVSWQKLNP